MPLVSFFHPKINEEKKKTFMCTFFFFKDSDFFFLVPKLKKFTLGV